MYKCSIGKKIEAGEKCEHVKAHEHNIRCNGTCYAPNGQLFEPSFEGEKVNKIVVACVEIPERIATEEI